MYLDNAATTKIHPDVLEAMLPYMKGKFGNPNSVHSMGSEAHKAICKARQQVADLINCSYGNIIFTSSGTEANNLAILGLREYLISKDKKCIVTSNSEHESVLKSVEILGQRDGFETSYLGLGEDGKVSVKPLFGDDSILSRAGLVSVMYCNNEIGTLNPYKTISKLCRDASVLFHTDCVQAVGYYDIDVEDIQCDLLSISSHKINGPKGVGALFVREPGRKPITPLINGSRSQEFGMRGGTQNVAAIVGFGEACEITKKTLDVNRRTIDESRRVFTESLIVKSREVGIADRLHFNSPENSGKIVNFRFDGVDAETLTLALDSKGIYVSSGAACRNYSSEPSPVLIAKGLTADEARESIRVSFSPLEFDVWQIVSVAYSIVETVECLLSLAK